MKRSANRLRSYEACSPHEGLGQLEQVLFSPVTGQCKFLQFSSSSFVPFSSLSTIHDDSKTLGLASFEATGPPEGSARYEADPRLAGTRDLLEYGVVEDRLHQGFVSDFVVDTETGAVEHIIVYFLHGVREKVVDMKRVAEIDHTHSVLFLDGE